MTPGERIRQIREARGLSQGTLAARAGLSQAHLSDVERGRKSLTIERAQALAAALGATTLDEIWPMPSKRVA